MLNLPSGLASIYREYVDTIMYQVNGKTIDLVFTGPQLTDLPTDYTAPSSFDRYGGRVPLDAVKPLAGGPGSFAEQNTVLTVSGRLYNVKKSTEKDLKDLSIAPNQQLSKFNTTLSNEQGILQCNHAIIEGQKATLLCPPLRYGIMGEQYIIAYFIKEVLNG